MALFVSVTSSANRVRLGFSQDGTSTERWVELFKAFARLYVMSL